MKTFGSSSSASQDTFSFLYSRESDRIGSMVKKPENPHKELLTKTEFLKKRREELRAQGPTDFDRELLSMTKSERQESKKVDVEEILKHFKHNSKDEDPRYTSSNNDYGKKPPTGATFVAERASRQQGFSKSFNNVKPKNTSLNTSLSKSTVHPKLDPQFA